MRQRRRVLVAYSGGVDSGLVARVARDALGDDALAALADAESVSRHELVEARAEAEEIGIDLRVLEVSELANKAYVANPTNRCYFCRKELARGLRPLAAELGYTTIVISHVTFCFPFVMAAVQARLAGLDPALEEAALDLGATPLQAFSKVLVPYLMPAIVSGALMSFTLSLDELIVTYFTASAGTRTLPLEIFGRVKKGLDPSLNAISTVFILFTVIAVFLTEALRRRNP